MKERIEKMTEDEIKLTAWALFSFITLNGTLFAMWMVEK